MKIVNVGEGDRRIPYEEMGTILSFNEDELMFNLKKYERDFPMHLDICRDEFGCLAMGLAQDYVAQVDIPAKEYEEIIKGEDADGQPIIEKKALPLDMEQVTLTLWNLEE